MPLSAPLERAFKASLPFTLTGAQDRVLFDVLNDLRRPIPMSRSRSRRSAVRTA